MGDKHLTEKGWNDVAPKGLKDKRLGNALRDYGRLPEDRIEARTKCLDVVIRTARDFKKLAECQPQLKYLDAVIEAAEAAKAQIRKEEEKAARAAAENRKAAIEEAGRLGHIDGFHRVATKRRKYREDAEILKAYDAAYNKGLEDSATNAKGEVQDPPPPPDE